VLPLVAEGFFDPNYQIPSKLPDPPAAFFAGAALFSLLNSSGARQPLWLLLFGVCASFAALSRFIAAGYVLVICGPILAIYLLNLWRKESEWKRLIARALVCVAIPILVLCGTFLLKHGPSNFEFYAYAAYGLNQTLAAVLRLTLVKFAVLFLGSFGLATLGILTVIAVAERGFLQIFGMWDTIWAAFSHIVLIVFVLRVADDSPQLIYAYPGLLLLAAAPFRAPAKRLGVFHGGAALMLTRAIIETSLPDGRIPTVEAGFSYYGRYVAATAIIDFARLVSYQQRFFDMRESQWTLWNRNAERGELFRRAVEKIDANIDFLAVLEDPAAPEARTMLYDDYTVAMAKDLNMHIAAHPRRWLAMKRFESPWGPVMLYRNAERT
jgi:hypothetical protein